MRSMLAITLLLASTTSFAGEVISDADARKVLAWHQKCEPHGDQCRLAKIVDIGNEPGAGQAGVAVSYDKRHHSPNFITIITPTGVPQDSEVAIRFVDSVQRDGKWSLQPVGDDFIALPVSGCDENSCEARVHPRIPGGPDLFEEMKKRRFLWILFKRGNEPERAMVPLPGMNDALREIDSTAKPAVPAG